MRPRDAMPKRYSEIDTSPFLDLSREQKRKLTEFQKAAEACLVSDDFQWTCFAWGVDPLTRRRTYPGEEELLLKLDAAVKDLQASGVRWRMVGEVVKSPPDDAKRHSGRWHVHCYEISGRLPSADERLVIHGVLKQHFSDVSLMIN